MTVQAHGARETGTGSAPGSSRAPSLDHDPDTCSFCLYTNLGVMCAAGINAAFSDGRLREEPDAYHRWLDTGR